MLLARSAIRLDGGTQPRAVINSPLFEEYAQAIADGAALPPIVVFYDGTDYWLADGFHRYYAHETLGLAEIDADVRQGSRRDAVLHSVGANADHGWRRSNDDKRRAVLALLNDVEWSGWSDSAIARQCRVSHTFVAKLRPAPPVTCNGSSEATRSYRDRHGNEGTMNVAAIGRAAKPLTLVAGRVPNRQPRPGAIGNNDEVGIGTASLATGFSRRRLSALARSGEVPEVRKDGGSWVFGSEALRSWIKTRPEAPPAADPAPIAYDHEANRPFLAALETLEAIIVGVGPAELLAWWKTYTGSGFEGDTVARAAAWINYFADGYAAAERSRQDLLARINEEACQ